MANKAKDKQSKKDADRLKLTELVKDRHFSGFNLKTGEAGLRELSDAARDDKYDSDYEFTKSELYGTPVSKGAISAGVKKLKDAPFLKRFGSRTDRGKLDKKATQAAREAGAEERREARGMKKGGSTSKFIQSAIKKPGALRKSLGVKKGEKIPASKLAKAAKAPGKMGQRARLAQTLKKMK